MKNGDASAAVTAGPTEPAERLCFVVSAFGSTPEAAKTHKQVLRHLIKKVLEPDYRVVRADEIDDEGLITNQIIERLLTADLVVADLTGLNPNVFYEVAVRHAARKPIVHLITAGQRIPFDVANMRAVPYALDDPDILEAACEELARKVRAIEETNWTAAQNPITAARDVWLLRDSDEPAERDAGALLGAFNALRDEVRHLARRLPTIESRIENGPMHMTVEARDALAKLVEDHVISHGPLPDDQVHQFAWDLGIPEATVRYLLNGLSKRKALHLVNGTWSDIPF